jgi:two-component system, NtrC family, C4-dicarboxylate transport sensor histidine kinase DctB
MIDQSQLSGTHPSFFENSAPGKSGRMQTIDRFRNNLDRLLAVQSNTERELTKSHEALVHAGKMAAVGRMVASVNHEIKRPIGSMRLLAENTQDLIARGDLESANANIAMLLRAVDQLADLSRQLECFSRKTPLCRTMITIQEAVANARSLLLPKLKSGKHTLQVQLDAPYVFADLDRLTLILVNLIDNAIDATVDAPDRRIDVHAQQEGTEVVIRVRDHGAGISEAVMEKLFDAFFTTKPAGKGIGLGLALSTEVIAEMDGKLSVRNHPDGGAEFSIRLPLVRLDS